MPKEHKHRLFFAIDLEPLVKSKLLAIQDRMADVVGKRVPGENFHITLSFLGAVAERDLEAILDHFTMLDSAKSFGEHSQNNVAPFSTSLNEVIYWSKPDIIVAAINDPEKHLLKLKKFIESQLTTIGHFQFDKKTYKPHVTLFRKVEDPAKHLKSEQLELDIFEFCLMESVQGKNGVQYHVLDSWRLNHSSIKQQLLGP